VSAACPSMHPAVCGRVLCRFAVHESAVNKGPSRYSSGGGSDNSAQVSTPLVATRCRKQKGCRKRHDKVSRSCAATQPSTGLKQRVYPSSEVNLTGTQTCQLRRTCAPGPSLHLLQHSKPTSRLCPLGAGMLRPTGQVHPSLSHPHIQVSNQAAQEPGNQPAAATGAGPGPALPATAAAADVHQAEPHPPAHHSHPQEPA
jgi:hypothetical protein